MFAPHIAASRAGEEPLVWAIDAAHAPGFWFPRDCPRACCWLRDGESAHALLGAAARLHAIQTDWLAAMRACALYVYAFDPAPFVLHDGEAGHWIARARVRPLSVAPVGDLITKHEIAGIPLRVVDDLRPLIAEIVGSGLGFSIYRQRNL